MANISKSTPYVRYREKFTSNVHLGTIHVESEYLDNTRPTTIESIHGMTWHNRIYNENKELPVLSDRNILLNTKQREYFDTGEKRVPIDEIHGLEDCVANSDGTYTYKVETIEGDYAETYNGINHITSSSNGLSGEVEITYNTNEEDITGSLVFDMANGGNVTIENSKQGELTGAILKGNTLVNLVKESSEIKNVGKASSTLAKYQVNHIDITKDYTVLFEINDFNGSGNISFSLGTQSKGVSLEEVNHNGKFNVLIPSSIIGSEMNEIWFYWTTGNWVDGNSATIKNIVLIEGDYTNVEIPYFEGMQSVRMPVLKTTGKNIFDKSKLTTSYPPYGGYDFGDGVNYHTVSIYDNDTSVDMTGCSFGIANGSNSIYLMYSNNTYNATSKTTNVKNLAFYPNNQSTWDKILKRFKVQIEQGSTITSYEPHKSNILTCNEGVELRGIGDVQDELNLLTGELVERTEELELNITEVKFDGVNTNGLDRFIVTSSTLPKSDQLISSNAISNNGMAVSLNYNYGRNNTFSYSNSTKRFYFTFTKGTMTSEELLNKLTTDKMVIIFKRDVPVTKTLDLSIVDQNGKSQPALATYPNVTHINASSDTLIPSGQVDFKVASSIETVTGIDFTIENGEHSDLINGMLYGDTLLNVLPSPSLKNSMGYNTSTQKLNKGYENINVVDGEFKEVTLYGQTMVNIEGMKSVENPTIIITNSPMRFGKGGRI